MDTISSMLSGIWYVCREGYHSSYGDETGQCYPNEGDSGCESENMILTE